MKKFKRELCLFLSLIVFCSLLSFPAHAGNLDMEITASYRQVKLVVDGAKYTPRDGAGNVVEPFIYEGTTYLPVRAVSEALGRTVRFDTSTNTVIIEGRVDTSFGAYEEPVRTDDETITISYRDVKISVDGILVTPKDASNNDVEAFICGGTTYLPVRGISTLLDKTVTFDSSTNTVYIGLQPVDSIYTISSPAPIGTSQLVLVNNGKDKFIARVSITKYIAPSEASAMLYKASPQNMPPHAGYIYGMVTVSVTIVETADNEAVTIDQSMIRVFSGNSRKQITFSSITAPQPSFKGTLRKGQVLTGYYPYIIPTNEYAPRCVFGGDENGDGGAWMRLYQG